MKNLSKILFCSTLALGLAKAPELVFASTDNIQSDSVVIYDDDITITPLYSLPSDLVMPQVKESFIQPYDLGIPAINNFKYLNVGEKQPFWGVANNSTLYSEQNTKGLNTATIEITNYLSKNRVAYLMKNNGKNTDTLVATFNPYANTTMGWAVSRLDPNAYYYMKFPSPSNFKGFIWRTN